MAKGEGGSRVFGRTFGIEEFLNARRRKRIARRGRFVRRGRFLSMCHEEAFDVAGRRENDRVIILVGSDAVILMEETKIFEGGAVFVVEAEAGTDFVEERCCDILAWARKGKVVNLS